MSTLVRREALLVAAIATLGLHLLSCPSAHAQSAYSMTTLAKPAGALTYAPTSLASDGTVRGGMTYWAGFGNDPSFACVIFCTASLPREVSWGNTTGTTASASVGLRNFFPAIANEKGTQAGRFTTDKTVLGRDFLVPSTTAPRRAVDITSAYPATHVRLNGGTPAELPTLPNGRQFTAWDVNDNDVIVGNDSFLNTPLVWRQGATTALPFAPFPKATAARVNDAGVIVGWVSDPSVGSPGDRLAIWRDGQLVTVGGPETVNRTVVAFNNAGQILMADSLSFGNFTSRGYIWQDGVLTTFTDPKGRSVEPTAMNDDGTVVGCTRVVKIELGTQVRTDFEPFIWRNGSMQDLTEALAAKGVKLPSGTRFGCPTAINKQGSMLIYHYKTSAPDKVTWVKVNAKP